MKKLTYSTFMCCALIFILISCSKDPIRVAGGTAPAQLEVPSISINASNAEILLNAYSTLPASTPFLLSIDGQIKDEFYVQTTAKKNWDLGNLKPGTYKIRVYAKFQDDDDANKFCSFQFNVNDGSTMHSITCRKLDDRNYGFDIIVAS
jgi:hypothetical protein